MNLRRLLSERLWGRRPRLPTAPGAQLTPELRARIKTSFDQAAGDEEHFPSTIDPRIYHVKLIREHLGELRGRRVLDVGCGKGRFARIFHEQEPAAEFWGLDISAEMLRFVPAGIHAVAGSMTELPFARRFFDGAYATESLEHAVEIEKAVGEICRVVKPGGRIAIIDKNAEQWGRLETPEWESWFTPNGAGATPAPAIAATSPAASFPIGRTSSPTACSSPGWRRDSCRRSACAGPATAPAPAAG